MTETIHSRLCMIALVLLAACSDASDPTVSEPIASVSTAAVKRGDLPISVMGYGIVTFDPVRQTILTTEIEVRVKEVLVQPGASVEKGVPLIRLVPSSASGLELAQARAAAVAATAELERQKRLRADGLASDADVERARTKAADTAARIRTLERNAGAVRELTAPMSGVVDAVFIAPGDVIASGSQLLRLSDPNALQARINLELEDATRLASGGAVQLEGLGGGTHRTDAVIASVDLRIDPNTRMASIVVPIPPGTSFLAGEAVRAVAVAEIRRNVLLVPRRAIFTDEQGDYVFIDKGGVAERRRIESGETSGTLTEITSSISDGEEVVTEGGAVLSDGMKLDTAGAPPDQPTRSGEPQ